MVKKEITKEEYLMLEGLTSLRDDIVKRHREIESSIGNLLGEEGDDGYFGLVSDFMWEDFGAKQLLKDLGIRIKKDGKNKK